MSRAAEAEKLAERLGRPKRVGLFGNRGVGKTTLLTMLYREAVGGRLPGLRLAAADARTADYLGEKIQVLEAGQPLPATLAETELRFHLYHGDCRLELLVKDYQGEHVSLGRREEIWDFLRDCDAVLLCLDAGVLSRHAERRRCQQEVEQLMEDYLAGEPQPTLDRPFALVLTKADLLNGGDAAASSPSSFDMVHHALAMHCPTSGFFAVSSLGLAWSGVKEDHENDARRSPSTQVAGDREADASGRPELAPLNLADPLVWLADALQRQDEAWLERLGATGRLDLLGRAVAAFARRYPSAPLTRVWQQRLGQLRRQRARRRAGAAVALAAALLAALWSYDALGHQQAMRFDHEHADAPALVLANWQQFQNRHPTRFLLGVANAQAERARLEELEKQLRRQQRDERLAELRRRADDPDQDPEALWRQFQHFRGEFPEVGVAGDLEKLRGTLKARRDQQLCRRAQLAFDELVLAEQRSQDWDALLAQAGRFLRDFAGTPPEVEVRRRQEAYLQRIDERDIQVARDYSARNPLNFLTRREHYQHYLDRHPAGGAFTVEARSAIQAIDVEWDKHSFRQVRDHFVSRPGQVAELVARCRSYLAVHPNGRFKNAALDLLRWSERVTAPGDYRVTLRWGSFDRSVAYFFSRGPDLSVELEVAGVRYGPSPVVANHFEPEWDYEFPRRIRWKLGDPVIIRVTDHDWKDRVVAEFWPADGDPLAIRLLAGEAWSGPNRLVFESDFTMPKLPRIE